MSNTRLERYLSDAIVIHYRDQCLLYTKANPLQRLPAPYHKYISRAFHVNHYARDIPYLLAGLQTLINTQHGKGEGQDDVYLRIQTFPSVLAEAVRDVVHSSMPAHVHVSGIAATTTTVNGSNSSNEKEEEDTHLLQIVYSAGEAIFRYGLHSLPPSIDHLDSTANGDTTASSDDNDGVPVICRAQHKLAEVFQMVIPSCFHASLPHLSASLQRSLAIDVGGAPGGWTLYLSTLCERVLSIDPAELHDTVLQRENVKHLRTVVQHPSVDQEVLAAMHLENTEKKGRPLRVIACDVNFDPQEAIQALTPLIPHLSGFDSSSTRDAESGAPSWFILTLKLLKGPKPRHVQQACRAVMEVLLIEHREASWACKGGCSCWRFDCTHLAANSKNERTLICKLH